MKFFLWKVFLIVIALVGLLAPFIPRLSRRFAAILFGTSFCLFGTVLALGLVYRSRDRTVRTIEVQEPLPEREIAVTELDWPWWRGLHQNGVRSTFVQIPTTWDERTNICWKVPIAGQGHSSPCVVGEKVLVTSAIESEQLQFLLCFSCADGRLLWRTNIHQGKLGKKHPKNTHASATPASDGSHVFVSFGNDERLWVTAVDLDGSVTWQTSAGDYQSSYGYASSVTLHGSLVIVAGDGGWRPFLAALDHRNGRLIWRIVRPGESYGTPIVTDIAGRPQLLLAGKSILASYETSTGREIWRYRWDGQRVANSVTFFRNRVYTCFVEPSKQFICVDAGGTGDVTSTAMVWQNGRVAADVPSPLVHDGLLFVISDDGIASCLSADTGEMVWRRRLGGDFSASPILANGLIYAPNEQGVTTVFKAAREFQLVAKNSLGEPIMASPAIGNDRFFLRTTNHLYCIGFHQPG